MNDVQQVPLKLPSYIDSAVIIAVITALAYFGVYSYEAGYCGYFEIPRSVIVVDINNLLPFWISALFFLVVSVAVIVPVNNAFEKYKYKWPMIVRMLAGNAVLLCAFSIQAFLEPITKPTVVIYTVVFFATNLFFFFKYRDLNVGMINEASERSSVGAEQRRKGLRKAFAITSLTLLVISSPILDMLGRKAAQRETKFHVLDGMANTALVKKYGNDLICVEYKNGADGKLWLTGKFHMIHVADSHPLTFTIKNIGNLMRAY